MLSTTDARVRFGIEWLRVNIVIGQPKTIRVRLVPIAPWRVDTPTDGAL